MSDEAENERACLLDRPRTADYAQYVAYTDGNLVGLMVLCGVMCAVTAGFLGFHLYLIAKGLTTNEFYKVRAS